MSSICSTESFTLHCKLVVFVTGQFESRRASTPLIICSTFCLVHEFRSSSWSRFRVLLCLMSNPGGCVRPSMMSLRVSGVLPSVLASSSTPLVRTLLSTHCRRPALPIWSALPPTRDRKLERSEKFIQKEKHTT